ncbi:WD40 repeat domain-containing protein [Dactylosporangium salmoneum]|uniref:Uncharacterized protein n=1 Tax=Dactylosporangium salmoneum TaxID=53361 RepID=A0ABP5SJZ5_9ACTN
MKPATLPFGAQIVPPLQGHIGEVNAVVCGLVDGYPVAVTGGDDCTVRVWDMASHRQLGDPLRLDGEVRGLACTVLDGRPVVVAVAGVTVDVWDLGTRQRIGAPLRVSTLLWGVSCTELAGRQVAVTSGAEVLLWDVATGEQISDPLVPYHHDGWIKSVACATVGGAPIAVSADEGATVQVWDLTRREPIGRPLSGRAPLAVATVDGIPLAVCTDDDNRLRLWDLSRRAEARPPLTGSGEPVQALALGAVAGRPVVVTGHYGHAIRVWDLRSGRAVGAPLFDGRDTYSPSSLAVGTLRGRPLVLAANGDGLVRVWDLDAYRALGAQPPARFAKRLPPRWTDPLTGHVYHLTRPLVDEEGDHWEYVDFDGFEPIVAEDPADLRCTFGISRAHEEYGFAGVGPRRKGWSKDADDDDLIGRPILRYHEFRALAGPLSQEQVTALRERYRDATIYAMNMLLEVHLRDDEDGLPLTPHEQDTVLAQHFDICLDVHHSGGRGVTIRVPGPRFDLGSIAPYLTEDGHQGVGARLVDGVLLVELFSNAADDEQPYSDRALWLDRLLPLHADLATGDLAPLYLGWLRAVQDVTDRDIRPRPPIPHTARLDIPQVVALAEFLRLDDWSRAQLAQ